MRALESLLQEPRFSDWPAGNGGKGCQSLLSLLKKRIPEASGRHIHFGFVPGRIEVLGRHTDYAGGRCLVCAIDHGLLFAAASNAASKVMLYEDSSEFEPIEFPLEPSLSSRPGHWENYPMTMASRLARNFGGRRKLAGVTVVFSSSLPVGSGMSGSSALMMMVFTTLALANRLNEQPVFRQNIHSPMDLSVYLACAENGQGFRGLEGDRGVGTFGGSEDHAAILNGRQGLLSLVGFHPPMLHAEIPWPPEWRLVVGFSGARAEKTREAQEKYNLVSRRARDAVAAFNRLSGTQFATLCEVADEISRPNARTRLPDLDASGGGLAAGLTDRLRQFILEDRHNLPGAVDALHNADMRRFGSFLSASHRASRKYLWNIAPEIDYLQKSAVDLGAAGASGFGGGFGGSILACVDAEHAESFRTAWMGRYAKRHPERAGEALFFTATPGPGIQVWDESGPRRLVDLLFQDRTPLSPASTL